VAARAAAARTSLPNIVYIMTDDQDLELGGLTPMPKTRRLLGDQGATGEAFYISTPICCPSRTSTLSGRLYHNVLGDDLQGCMHVNSTGYIFEHETSIFPALQRAGYLTGGFGKIINSQMDAWKNNITNGWSWLSAPNDEGAYFEHDFFEKRLNGSTYFSSLGKPADVVDDWYQTSQIGNRSLEFIEAAVALKAPFVAYLGPHAPHYSADSPPWARGNFADVTAPRTPAYNASGDAIASKAQHVAQNPPLDAEAERWIDIHMRNRWRAIQGVDDMIALVVERLETLGVLDNTYIFFSSDHGCAPRALRRARPQRPRPRRLRPHPAPPNSKVQAGRVARRLLQAAPVRERRPHPLFRARPGHRAGHDARRARVQRRHRADVPRHRGAAREPAARRRLAAAAADDCARQRRARRARGGLAHGAHHRVHQRRHVL
jgi:arylsulfatase A-like enzyme